MHFATLLPLVVLASTAFAAPAADGDEQRMLVKRQGRMNWNAYVAAMQATSSSSSTTAPAATSTKPARLTWAELVSLRNAQSSSATTPTRSTTTTRSTTSTRAPTTTSRSTTSAARSSTTTTTTTSAAPTATLPAGTSSKKGVGYNDAKLTRNLAISWAYNWGQYPDGELSSGVEFVPMLWNDNPGNWFTNAQAAIDSGSTHLLGFNEPDLVGQADMTIPETVQAWKTYMSPFYGKAKLVSPAVTNGGFPMGRDYLKHFFGNCTVCYEQTSAVALHWYDASWNTGYFYNYLTEAYQMFQKPIWLTEFAGSGSSAEQQAFFKQVLPWMEQQPWIERYAGFGDFVGTYVNADASLTPLGQVYSDTV